MPTDTYYIEQAVAGKAKAEAEQLITPRMAALRELLVTYPELATEKLKLPAEITLNDLANGVEKALIALVQKRILDNAVKELVAKLVANQNG